MQKKMVGILAGVATVHAVLLVGLMVGGGCRQPEILGPHTYNSGPEFANVPPAVEEPASVQDPVAPKVDGAAVLPPPPVVDKPVEVLPPSPVEPAGKKDVVKGGSVYKVKRGDTLSLIAFKHGVSVKALAACNNLSGKAMNIIRPGQELTIPEGGVYDAKRVPAKRARAVKKSSGKKAAAVAVTLPADGMYVVKSGDSLDRIGRRYGVSAKAIARENNIDSNKILHIGDKLRIPGKSAGSAAVPVAGKSVPAEKAPAADTLNVDDLDPQLGMTDAGEPAAATAAEKTGEAADAAVPAAGNTAPAAGQKTESFEIPNDTTVEEFSTQMQIPVEELRRLNPNIPADGKLSGGTYLLLPVLQ